MTLATGNVSVRLPEAAFGREADERLRHPGQHRPVRIPARPRAGPHAEGDDLAPAGGGAAQAGSTAAGPGAGARKPRRRGPRRTRKRAAELAAPRPGGNEQAVGTALFHRHGVVQGKAAAIGVDSLAGEVAGLVAREEDGDLGDFGGLADAAERRAGEHVAPGLLG